MSYVNNLKNKVLAGELIDYDEAVKLVDSDINELIEAANEIREHFCGDKCDVCSVISVKEGKCTENCKYCSQSQLAEIPILDECVLGEKIITEDAVIDEKKGSGRFCLVSCGRRLSKNEVKLAEKNIRDIHSNSSINICASFGLLDYEDFKLLKAAGLSMIHNNLETSSDYFPEICSSHTIEQKKETIRAAKKAGLMVCSGGLLGIGETVFDRIKLAFELRELEVDSVPLNLLNPREGTPFYNKKPLTEEEYVQTAAIFRFVMPKVMIRLAAGRGRFEDDGKAALKAGANAVISGDFLTTNGTSFEKDFAMIRECGFKVGHV